MKFSTKILFGIFLAVFAVRCAKEKPKSVDFTHEFSFTKGIEGPAVNAEGELFAVNFKREGTIGKVDASGKGEIFVNLPDGSIGNGIRFDVNGNMFIADYMGHKVYRIKKNSTNLEVWAQDSTMNQPNDLAMNLDGTIYLSDPDWSNGTGKLWMVSPSREMILLEENMGTTNGIEVSPDGKKLYVNESVQRNVWQYDIFGDGTVGNKRKLISFVDFGLDGMRCDVKGNLYITRYGKGAVAIVSPEGKVLDEIILRGKKPSNIAFGGEDGKSCFVTLQDRGCIETFRAANEGNFFNLVYK